MVTSQKTFVAHNKFLHMKVARNTKKVAQVCFNIIVCISHLQVPLLVQKGIGTLSRTTKMYGNVVPTSSHATTTQVM